MYNFFAYIIQYCFECYVTKVTIFLYRVTGMSEFLTVLVVAYFNYPTVT